jgi:hypothetical protein
MVLPDSSRISRVPPYSGTHPTQSQHLPCTGLSPPAVALPSGVPLSPGFLHCAAPRARRPSEPYYPSPTTMHVYHVKPVWAPPPSLAATKGISGLISSPPGTEMVQFPGSRHPTLCIQIGLTGSPSRPGYPIRSPPDLRMFAPPRGFSQLTATFFARQLQGIHRGPLFA